jgi:hypothetical protein
MSSLLLRKQGLLRHNREFLPRNRNSFGKTWVLAARLVVRGSSVLGMKFNRMIGQIREIVKDDSYSRHIHTVNGLKFGHANACSPAMSGMKSDQPCAPACVMMSQMSMIGRVTPAAGVPLVRRRRGWRQWRVPRARTGRNCLFSLSESSFKTILKGK